MEIKHASPESFFRYVHCEGYCKKLSKHEVTFKNVFFNQVSGQNDICYTVCCLNCRMVFKKKYIEQTKTTTQEKWNLFFSTGTAP